MKPEKHEWLESAGFVLILCPRCDGTGMCVSGVSEMSDCRCCNGRGSIWLRLAGLEQNHE